MEPMWSQTEQSLTLQGKQRAKAKHKAFKADHKQRLEPSITSGAPAMCACFFTNIIYVGVLSDMAPQSQSVFRDVYMRNIWIKPEVTEGVHITNTP